MGAQGSAGAMKQCRKPNGQDAWFLVTRFTPRAAGLQEEEMKLVVFFFSMYLKNLLIFKLKDNCFTEFCWCLPNISVNQP